MEQKNIMKENLEDRYIMDNVRLFDDTPEIWDRYIENHQDSTLYHLFAWGLILEEALGHKRFYIAAYQNSELNGILPLILVKSKLFGSGLISMPFLNYGGVCANNYDTASLMYIKAINLARENKVDYLELRNIKKPNGGYPLKFTKAAYVLSLADDEEVVFKNLRKQTRNRIRKAIQQGIKVEVGHHLLNDFYVGFSIAMKEHGTPVLGLKFFYKVLEYFGDKVQFYVAYYNGQIAGAKLTITHKDISYQIWGGYPKSYRNLQANYLLSWKVVNNAINLGLKYCDFGRSDIKSGPADFKRRRRLRPPRRSSREHHRPADVRAPHRSVQSGQLFDPRQSTTRDGRPTAAQR